MTLERWALFLATDILLSLAPGPAVLLVLAHALRGGVRPSLCASGGILFGNALYFAVSATGLGAILAASYRLFMVVKWAGAAYLVYLGLAAIFRRAGPLSMKSAAPVSGWRTFLDGLVLQLANPKSLLFFVVILPQFVDLNGDVVMQVLVLGVTSVSAEFVVLAMYGLLASRFHRIATTPRFAAATDRLAGACLVVAAAATVAASRA